MVEISRPAAENENSNFVKAEQSLVVRMRKELACVDSSRMDVSEIMLWQPAIAPM
jgi:hypothetical protein